MGSNPERRTSTELSQGSPLSRTPKIRSAKRVDRDGWIAKLPPNIVAPKQYGLTLIPVLAEGAVIHGCFLSSVDVKAKRPVRLTM
jgi:hypothetical protein